MQIGDTLNQRYTLTAHLGSGAMGDVYQATDTATGQPVAVKILDRKLTLDPDIVERFKREGEALRQLRHRHIVSFVDTFQHEGQQVIVMECVSGGSLHALIKRGPLPVEQARQMAIDLCDALTSAHRLNIIHRDIKPENVLLAEGGTPKLTDFGVARLVREGTRLTGTGTQIGTPFYMSPEAWQGQPLDAQADVWSLGVMLHEMLTGEVPFGGDTLIAVMNKVLTAPLPDLKKLRPETPPALVKIVRRMLERDKAKRYQSLRQVAVDLEQVTVAPAPAATSAPQPPAPRTQVAPPAKGGLPRWAWVVGGLALALVLCLVAAGGGALAMKMLGQAPPTAALATATPQPTTTPVPPIATVPPSETPVPATTLPASSALGIGATQVSPNDGMVQVYVPAGDFLMGSTDSDALAASNEKPQHTVYLDAYWIDKTEVTQGMYAQCVAAGKCAKPGNSSGGDNYPVIGVSSSDAVDYCAWAGRRLPTEAEWEKAARGTDGRLYPWGNQAPSPTLVNPNLNMYDTTEVGKYPAGASPYGALDMAGNAWEWVNDWYAADYYSLSPAKNPPGPAAGTSRVLRGGTWTSSLGTTAWRTQPLDFAGAQSLDDGFRCAQSGETPVPPASATVSSALGIGATQVSPMDAMVQVYVPAGDFLMGSADTDFRAKSDEKPQHTVRLDAFWIDQTEVTQGRYTQCVAAGKCRKPTCSNGSNNYPVICVSWNDASNYCPWAGRRLATEAEWEKAARGSDGRLYIWGNEDPTSTLANFGGSVGATSEVGKYLAGASPYGALDMAGNVWEWVNDWYDANYYSASPASNPPGPTTPGISMSKVWRGGSWSDFSLYLRVTSRRSGDPQYQANFLGFRCAAPAVK